MRRGASGRLSRACPGSNEREATPARAEEASARAGGLGLGDGYDLGHLGALAALHVDRVCPGAYDDGSVRGLAGVQIGDRNRRRRRERPDSVWKLGDNAAAWGDVLPKHEAVRDGSEGIAHIWLVYGRRTIMSSFRLCF